jgi:hypothetical protein
LLDFFMISCFLTSFENIVKLLIKFLKKVRRFWRINLFSLNLMMVNVFLVNSLTSIFFELIVIDQVCNMSVFDHLMTTVKVCFFAKHLLALLVDNLTLMFFELIVIDQVWNMPVFDLLLRRSMSFSWSLVRSVFGSS